MASGVKRSRRPAKAFVARIRRHAPPSGIFPARATLSRATTSMLMPGRLRSRLIFCVMSLMPQGAHRGRPVAAAPCTPGLRPATSPLRGPFDLSLQASGRAEAASMQNTALSPHPCGLPRPSGNVSAILRPPAPAVSVAQVVKLTTGRTNRRPDKAFMPPSGTITGTVPDRPAISGSLQRFRQIVTLHPRVREVGQRHLQLIA